MVFIIYIAPISESRANKIMLLHSQYEVWRGAQRCSLANAKLTPKTSWDNSPQRTFKFFWSLSQDVSLNLQFALWYLQTTSY